MEMQLAAGAVWADKQLIWVAVGMTEKLPNEENK
jgi:hypothetical protein